MSEATIILQNMRGGCATVDGKVHTLFRVSNRRPRSTGNERATSGPTAELYFRNYYSMRRPHQLQKDSLALDPGR